MILPHTIELLGKTAVTSNYSGVSFTYPATGSGTSYRAYMQPRTGSPAVINETMGARDNWVCYVDPSCPAEIYDRFIFDGETYEVTDRGKQYSPRNGHHVKLMAVRLSQV